MLLYYYHYDGTTCVFEKKKNKQTILRVVKIKGNKLSLWNLYLFTILQIRTGEESTGGDKRITCKRHLTI